jgi:hypothetical protein
LWNTNTFRRQLENTTIDACVAASGALKAAVHKTIELKANKVDKRAGPGCLNRVSASIGGASAGVRLPCGVAAG